MLASPALAGATHSFPAFVSGSRGIHLPSVSAPSHSPARRAALVVLAKAKVSTPNADRIARHDRLRKKVLPVNLRHEDWASLFSCLFANARRFV
uniref:Uncharacterized protein n=1 Tax=Aegilops tauschii subsp. strangulata TaxID=200361 RepID=A0A453MBZ9_AEGTS